MFNALEERKKLFFESLPEELQEDRITNAIKEFLPPKFNFYFGQISGYIDIPERYYSVTIHLHLVGPDIPETKYSVNLGDFEDHMKDQFSFSINNFYQERHTGYIVLEIEFRAFREGRYWSQHVSKLGYLQIVEYENDGSIVPGQDNIDEIDWNQIVPVRR